MRFRHNLAMRDLSPGWRHVLSLIGTSRHSALPELRARVQATTRPIAIRVVALAGGSSMIGFAVALLVQADLGLPPYDVLSSGLADRIGLSLGQAGWVVAAVFFVAAALLGRRPSLWGIAYILANGLAIDGAGELLNEPPNAAGRIGFLIAAIIVMAAGINVVLFSGTTGGPFELLMLVGEDRGLSRTAVRYVLDVEVLVLGLLLGGKFGIGTIIYAALMGVVLQGINRALADYRTGRMLRLQS